MIWPSKPTPVECAEETIEADSSRGEEEEEGGGGTSCESYIAGREGAAGAMVCVYAYLRGHGEMKGKHVKTGNVMTVIVKRVWVKRVWVVWRVRACIDEKAGERRERLRATWREAGNDERGASHAA